ncbi:ketopantoate reductase [Rathayibacter sp. PhB151]|uniref:2-dehydropantoate 2-reductase n=1 Tax=Rathayibacter sp. PhB151 TaxID=2485189 RepID=UPI0010628821|nr:2-dehydropantoate 2-reductase [Rathayibacter sp. PhB151]TDX79145.1 ketopantoate reductase [Rathayibacter sp. PhB151]
MRILIVGAGATGGAFGSRLQEAGRDVTYLVRAGRAESLRRDGLRFVSPSEDRTLDVTTLVVGEAASAFDLVLVTVKASALNDAVADVRAWVTEKTLVLPILNGMAHIDLLETEFPGRVLGGSAKIVATLDGGAVRQMTGLSVLTIGSLTDAPVPAHVAEALDVPGIDLRVSDDVLSALWEKWVFIAAAGVVTCLFRSAIGPALEAGALPWILDAIEEAETVADAAGLPVSAAAHEQSLAILTEEGSAFTTSLYRDLVAGLPTEAEHLLGDLARRARELSVPTPLLDLTLVQIRAGAPTQAPAIAAEASRDVRAGS